MGDIATWSTTAAGNNTGSPPDFPVEGMAPSTVNDTMREIMAAVARFYEDTQGGLVTAGTGNAYTLATNHVHAALADQSLLVFRANRENTDTATLNVDGLGAKTIRADGSAATAGSIKENVLYAVAYNATIDAYDILGASGSTQSGTFTATHTGMSTSTTSTGTYRIVGGLACVQIAGVLGTSNADTYTITGIPAVASPALSSLSSFSHAIVFNNGTSTVGGGVAFNTGVITMHVSNASAILSSTDWATSGTKGIGSGGFTGCWIAET